MIGSAGEDYLKAIYRLSQQGESVSLASVAQQMEVSPAAATKMMKRLCSLRLAEYSRSGGAKLTGAGRRVALELIRHHRLIEMYLMKALGYRWDEVHDEAERLEHVISEEFEERIDAMLGRPTHDPHGQPIPAKDLSLVEDECAPLDALAPGERRRVAWVNDLDAVMLRYMGELGLYPGARVELIEAEPYGGSLRIRVDGVERPVGRELAANVFVHCVRKKGRKS
ncbi:MAG: metal-dependent transcriptional regulator [bacterium]|nr:metal-dependent transcriptional regulator [bacterium]